MRQLSETELNMYMEGDPLAILNVEFAKKRNIPCDVLSHIGGEQVFFVRKSSDSPHVFVKTRDGSRFQLDERLVMGHCFRPFEKIMVSNGGDRWDETVFLQYRLYPDGVTRVKNLAEDEFKFARPMRSMPMYDGDAGRLNEKLVDEPKGLFMKYDIRHADGSPVDPGGRYFVIKANATDDVHRRAALNALSAYALEVHGKYPELASDIMSMVDECRKLGDFEDERNVNDLLEEASRFNTENNGSSRSIACLILAGMEAEKRRKAARRDIVMGFLDSAERYENGEEPNHRQAVKMMTSAMRQFYRDVFGDGHEEEEG